MNNIQNCKSALIVGVIFISSSNVYAKSEPDSVKIQEEDFAAYINTEANINNQDINELNNIYVFESGKENVSNISIENSNSSSITVKQKKLAPGNPNDVRIKAEGVNNKIYSSQKGSNNTAYVVTNGDNNLAVMLQYGINNNGVINQKGDHNKAAIIQVGRDNYDIIEQKGSNNRALILNTAKNLGGSSGSQITQDNSSSPILLIDGMSRYSISVSSK